MSEVRLEALSKSYGDVTAIRDVSLEVAEGEFLTLLGPSGCGKTTTLQMVAGLLDPDEGQIYVGGVPMRGVAPHRRGVGVVFQHGAVFPHMSVRENVEYGLKMRKVPKEERARRAEEMLALVGLEGLGGRKPKQLSGGQRQRVALARALVIKPKVLLLDEPLSALDLSLRQRLRAEIRQIQQELGITTVFVTHDQVEALSMSDRIAVMSSGTIEQVGTPADIYASPASSFVAGFMGETNRISGRVVRTNGTMTEILGPGGLTLTVGNQGRPTGEGDGAIVLIRPEALRIAATGEAAGAEPRGADGEIYLRSFLGSNVRYHVAIDDEARLFVDVDAQEGAVFSVGDRVRVGCGPNGAFAFPEDRPR